MRLTDLLIADGVLEKELAEEILRLHSVHGGSIDTILLETGLLDEEKLQPYLERTYSIRNTIDPFGEPVPEALRLLKKEQAETYRAVPVRLKLRALDVLVQDPTNVRSIDEVSFISGCRLVVNVACELRIADHLHKWYQVPMPERLRLLLAGELALQGEVDLFTAKKSRSRRLSTGEKARLEFGTLPTVEVKDGGTPATGWLVSNSDAAAEATASIGGAGAGHRPPTDPAALKATRDLNRGTISAAISMPRPVEPPRPRFGTDVRRSYEQLAAQLAQVTRADDVPPVVLTYLQTLVYRVVLFALKDGNLRGWDARGPRLRREMVEPLRVNLTKPSVFKEVLENGLPFNGVLPQEEVEEDLMIRLAPPAWPEHVLIVPIRQKNRPVAILYGEAATPEALTKAREPVGVIAELVGEVLERISLGL